MPIARPLILAAALALAAALPGAAEARTRMTASNGLSVAGTAERFEVFARARSGGSDYFCAAGEFARRVLRARATDRVTVVAGLGRSPTRTTQNSVTFALSGPDRTQPFVAPLLLRPGRSGSTMSVGHAEFLCNQTSRSRPV
jgi:hypothetical protein